MFAWWAAGPTHRAREEAVLLEHAAVPGFRACVVVVAIDGAVHQALRCAVQDHRERCMVVEVRRKGGVEDADRGDALYVDGEPTLREKPVRQPAMGRAGPGASRLLLPPATPPQGSINDSLVNNSNIVEY